MYSLFYIILVLQSIKIKVVNNVIYLHVMKIQRFTKLMILVLKIQ